MKDAQQIGRLAMRAEGDWWNAYYALANTMENAIHLGSIRLASVASDPNRKQAFMDMMRGIVSDIIEEKVGVRPDWGGAQTAPETERAGSA